MRWTTYWSVPGPAAVNEVDLLSSLRIAQVSRNNDNVGFIIAWNLSFHRTIRQSRSMGGSDCKVSAFPHYSMFDGDYIGRQRTFTQFLTLMLIKTWIQVWR